jgi:single-stranded DNA-binding protein
VDEGFKISTRRLGADPEVLGTPITRRATASTLASTRTNREGDGDAHQERGEQERHGHTARYEQADRGDQLSKS